MTQIDGTAVITGAGRGLGRAFAHALARNGACVAVCDIDLDSAQKVASEIRKQGGRALPVRMDVSDPASVDEAIGQVRDGLGNPTILVNNAGILAEIPLRPFTEIPLDEWNRVITVNTTGCFLSSRAVAPDMIEAGRGKIINISSSTIWTGRPGYLHYVTSKSALVGMTRALANELGPHGINVNAVTPGATRTEVERAAMDEDRWRVVAEQAALRRHAVSEDIVGAVVFLASPLSDFMTGQVLNVDGGRSFP